MPRCPSTACMPYFLPVRLFECLKSFIKLRRPPEHFLARAPTICCFMHDNPICSYEELEASGSFAALERPASPTVTAPEDQPRFDAANAAVSIDEPAAPRVARARSRSTSTSGNHQGPPHHSVSSAPAHGLTPPVNGHASSEGMTVDDTCSSAAAQADTASVHNDDTATTTPTTAAAYDSTSVSEEVEEGATATATSTAAEAGGGGGGAGKVDVVVEVRVNADVDMKTEAENVDNREIVAAEAHTWVDRVAVDRIRSLSSMYRSEEGSQSLHEQQQLPRWRTASSMAARQVKEETGIEVGKEVPPELVVAEDQEVCGLVRVITRKVIPSFICVIPGRDCVHHHRKSRIAMERRAVGSARAYSADHLFRWPEGMREFKQERGVRQTHAINSVARNLFLRPFDSCTIHEMIR